MSRDFFSNFFRSNKKNRDEYVPYHTPPNSPLTKKMQDAEQISALKRDARKEQEKLNAEEIPEERSLDAIILQKKKEIIQCCLDLLTEKENNRDTTEPKTRLIAKMREAHDRNNKTCHYRLAVSKRATVVRATTSLVKRGGYDCQSATASVVDKVAAFFNIQVLAPVEAQTAVTTPLTR